MPELNINEERWQQLRMIHFVTVHFIASINSLYTSGRINSMHAHDDLSSDIDIHIDIHVMISCMQGKAYICKTV